MNYEKVNPNLNKEEAEFLQEVAKRIRNNRKIEYHIYQLQKQLHLGQSSLYNLVMKKLFLNYDEHSNAQRRRFDQPLANNKKLDVIEKDMRK